MSKKSPGHSPTTPGTPQNPIFGIPGESRATHAGGARINWHVVGDARPLPAPKAYAPAFRKGFWSRLLSDRRSLEELRVLERERRQLESVDRTHASVGSASDVYLQRTSEIRNRFLVGPPGLEPGTKAL